MATRKELIEGIGKRYRAGNRKEKQEILEEFTQVTGYHRKHAIRALNCYVAKSSGQRKGDRIYDEAVHQALIIVWEAADRICGKRLKSALPVMIEAMERHGHLALDFGVRQRLLAISASTIDRLLASGCLDEASTANLREQFLTLDPVALLHEIRTAQEMLAGFAATGSAQSRAPGNGHDIDTFVRGLATVWKSGETRPTHRRNVTAHHWWRSRADPFQHTWPTVEHWLQDEPGVSAKELMHRLAAMLPDVYSTTTQLRTLQRRVKAWRSERAKQLIFGALQQEALSARATALIAMGSEQSP